MGCCALVRSRVHGGRWVLRRACYCGVGREVSERKGSRARADMAVALITVRLGPPRPGTNRADRADRAPHLKSRRPCLAIRYENSADRPPCLCRRKGSVSSRLTVESGYQGTARPSVSPQARLLGASTAKRPFRRSQQGCCSSGTQAAKAVTKLCMCWSSVAAAGLSTFVLW